MLHTILMLVLVFSALMIIALVLVQRGKGADAGAGFGAGASGTVFGARGATTALSRTTAILAAVFMVTCLLLSYVVTRAARQPESLLDRLAEGGSTPVPTAPAIPSAAPAATPVPDSVPAVPETTPAQ